MGLFSLLSIRVLEILWLPALFSAVTVLCKFLTRIRALGAGRQHHYNRGDVDHRLHLWDVAQVGIELCVANLAVHSLAAIWSLEGGSPLRGQTVTLLVFVLVSLIPLLICVACQAILFPNYRLAETAVADVIGFLTFGYGGAALLNLLALMEVQNGH